MNDSNQGELVPVASAADIGENPGRIYILKLLHSGLVMASSYDHLTLEQAAFDPEDPHQQWHLIRVDDDCIKIENLAHGKVIEAESDRVVDLDVWAGDLNQKWQIRVDRVKDLNQKHFWFESVAHPVHGFDVPQSSMAADVDIELRYNWRTRNQMFVIYALPEETQYVPGQERIAVQQVVIGEHERVIVENRGEHPVDLAGMTLFTTGANQSFRFPAFVLQPGATVDVASHGHNGFSFGAGKSIFQEPGVEVFLLMPHQVHRVR